VKNYFLYVKNINKLLTICFEKNNKYSKIIMEKYMKKFVIIDGNNLMFRAFYALPQLANFQGEISNAVFGFANMIIKIINDVKPDYMAVAFDIGKKNFRHEKYAQYKGTRKPTPPELISQFPIAKDMLKKMNISVIEKQGLEADDLIGCLSRSFDVQNIIVSADRDIFQLVNNNTEILFPKKGITETITVTQDNLKEHYGVEPNQVVDLKSLMGDSSDNIPGVAGVGEKTAISLLEKYGSLDGVYENISEIKGKLQEKLITNKEMAYLSQDLATIVTNEDLGYAIEEFEYSYPFSNEVLELFKRYQFNSLLKKSELFESVNNVEKFEVERVYVTNDNLDTIMQTLNTSKEIAIFNKDENLYIYDEKEYVFTFSNDLLSNNLDIGLTLNKLKLILESEKIGKIVLSAKNLMWVFDKFGILLKNVTFDCLIARYLINSIAKQVNDINDLMLENGIDSENYAYVLSLIKNIYYAKMQEMDLLSLFYDVELPLVEVLFSMEKTGFKLDKDELLVCKEKYSSELKAIENEIYDIVGFEFNIASPKQLGEVLFDKLNLNTPQNKKKSTSVDVLNEIAHKHPVVPLILRYRTIAKLYSTYICGFEDLLSKDNKIHSVFNQTITSTGRLSSTEPNLQNIPVKTEEGRNLRKLFIPSFEGGKILSADYSQIELRLLASFSGDEKLIGAFKNGDDIHSKTASEIFGVSISEVTPQMRRNAKEINFGIIYGISDFGLSQNIGITRKQAKEYIELYFSKYPSIENYLNKSVEFAKENGYIKTYLGRIRPIPEINSSNYNLRSFGERASMNMPLQGSASDIIKLAMVNIFKEFNLKGIKSKIILQVHDELVIDVYPGEEKIVEEILKNGMENVVDLPVKLLVNVAIGDTWFEAK